MQDKRYLGGLCHPVQSRPHVTWTDGTEYL